MAEKDRVKDEQFPISQQKILLSMLKLKEASAYTLSKDTGMSYAIMHEGVAKLTALGYLIIRSSTLFQSRDLKSVDSKAVRSRTTYGLTMKGQETAERIKKLQKLEELNLLTNKLKEEESKDSIEYRKKLMQEIEAFTKGTLSSTIDKKKDLADYQNSKRRMLVIMPVSNAFDDVWKGAIERVCTAQKYACLKIDQMGSSSPIPEKLDKIIDETDIIVADITGVNPNVMFELGLALGMGKNIIILKQQDDHTPLPFDVSGFRYLSYTNTWSGVEKLRDRLNEKIVQIEAKKG